jgi:DNA invertase Pin-like site-specific DNA recombinase
VNKIKTVATYYRNSTQGQKDHGTIDAQKTVCVDFCARSGWIVVAEFKDEATSGNSPLEKRPGGKELVNLIKTGTIDAVVCVSVDRLTRSDKMAERGYIYDLLGEHDTAFASPREGIIHCNDLVGDVTYSIRSAVAREEREKIKVRTKAGIDQAKRDGRSTGKAPYGLKWVNLGKDHPNRGYWEANEDELKVLKEIFRLVKDGYALERIVDQFNADGVPSKYKRKWAGITLNRMLKNDFYFTGVLTYKDGVTVDTGIKLFTKGEIEEVRKHRNAHPATKRRITKNGNYEPGTYLLRGLLLCGCGRTLSPFKSGKGYYRCKRKGCRKSGLKMVETDRAVWNTFEHDLTDPNCVYDALKDENLLPTGDIKQAKKKAKVAEAKLMEIMEGKDRLVAQFALHRISKNKYEGLMTELEKNEEFYRREKLKAENTTHDSDAMETVAETAAKYMSDKIQVIKALKGVKDSLADADMVTKLKYTPRLIALMKDLGIALSDELKKPTLEGIKNLTFEIKRNILKDAILNGVTKIMYHKDGQVAVHGLLPLLSNATGCFG